MSGEAGFAASDAVDLLEWKHAIFDLYAGVRAASDPARRGLTGARPATACTATTHSRPSPQKRRGEFDGCAFYDYDPAWRTTARIEDAEPVHRDVDVSTGGVFSFTRIGIARFTLGGAEHALELAWNDGYGGGIFLAFTRRHDRRHDLRRRPLPDRHRQGRRPRLRPRCAVPPCSTSTSPSTRPAPTTHAGPARSPRRRTGCRSRSPAGERHCGPG